MNPRIKIRLFIFSVLASTIAFGQDLSVSGFISDSENNAISYANIVLITSDNSTVIKGTSSNDQGFFLIERVDPGLYTLRTSFIGFQDNTVTIEIIDSSLDIGDIFLEESAEALNEISIIAKKPTLTKEADRLVFNVANTALSEGNLMEVLKSTPSVLVLDGKLMVRNSTPTVYINDRKVQLSGSELMNLLEGSPASSIKSIEVITNPSAKYDASDGLVINIVMGKNLVTGYRGSIFGNYTQGVYPRYNAGITNFYKTDKINVYASYSYNNDKTARVSDEHVNFINDNDAIYEQWSSHFDRTTKSQTHTINTNFDYFINNTNTLSFSSNLLFLPEFNYVINGETQVFDPNLNALYNFNNVNNSNDEKYNLGFDLDYVRHFNNGSKLSLNTHLTTYDYKRDQKVKSNYFFTDTNLDFSNAYETVAKQNTLINTAQADYSLPIGDSAEISLGIKGSFINTDSAINQFIIQAGPPIFDPDASNAFEYNEEVLAAYANYEKNWKRWDLNFGLRLEQSNIEGRSVVTNNTLKQDYLNWFPTANVSFQASEKISVYSNYKRSIKRPDYQSLNPFRFYLNDNTVITGNPNLQPALTDHFTLGTSLNNSFFVEAYYNETKSNFVELPIQDNDNNLLIYTPTNITSTIDFGLDFLAYFDITSRWNVYFGTSFYNIEEQTTVNNSFLKMNTWSNYTDLNNSVSFLEDNSLSVNLSIIFYGRNQNGFQIVDSRFLSELTIKKMIWDNKWALTLAAADIFNTQDYTVTSKYLNQDNSRYLNQDNRYIKLGISYKFGNSGLETNQRTKERNERDRLEKN